MMELSFQAELHSRRDIFRRKDLNKFEAIGGAPLFMKMLAGGRGPAYSFS